MRPGAFASDSGDARSDSLLTCFSRKFRMASYLNYPEDGMIAAELPGYIQCHAYLHIENLFVLHSTQHNRGNMLNNNRSSHRRENKVDEAKADQAQQR